MVTDADVPAALRENTAADGADESKCELLGRAPRKSLGSRYPLQVRTRRPSSLAGFPLLSLTRHLLKVVITASVRILEILPGILQRTGTGLPDGVVREHPFVCFDPLPPMEQRRRAHAIAVVALPVRIRMEGNVQPSRHDDGRVMERGTPAIVRSKGDVVLDVHAEHQLGHVIGGNQCGLVGIFQDLLYAIEVAIEPSRHACSEQDT